MQALWNARRCSRLGGLGLLTLTLFASASGAGGQDRRPDALSDFVECATGRAANGGAGDDLYRLNLGASQAQWSGALGFNPSFVGASRGGNFEGPSFMRLMDLLSPQALRYPPGTYASFYDWESMTIDEPLAIKHANKAMLETIKHQRRRAKGGLIKSDYRSFLALARTRSPDPFIVLNLMTRDAEHGQAVVSKVKDLYRGSVRWELGNEVANAEYMRLRTARPWTVDAYVERVAAVSRFIRKSHPEDRIGVVGADLLVERGHVRVPDSIARFSRAWAERISTAAAQYDAVIFHPYVNLVDDVIASGMRERKSAPGCRGLPSDLLRAVVQYQWTFSAAQEVPSAYSDYARRFHPGKDIWLTEIGLFGGKAEPPLDFSASGVPRALFNLVYFAHWVNDVPSLGAYMYHVLDYGEGEFAAVNPDGSLNANGLSFLLLREMFGDGSRVGIQVMDQRGQINGVGPYRESRIAPIVALFSTANGARRVLVANVGLSQVRLVSPFASARVRTLGGGPAARIERGTRRTLDDIPAMDTTENIITLPPMSINLVEQRP